MTIKDLSSMTGYSVGTISRVLNNQPNVSDKARKAILAAAEESGFQINANAKQLKQSHGNSILVVVKGTSNELFGNLVEAIQARLAHTPYPLEVDYQDEDLNEVLRAVRLCREKKPQGVLFLGGNTRNFAEAFHQIQVPCVLVTNDASQTPFENLSSVSSDDRAAGRLAIEHLVAQGHRKIVLIGGDRTVSDTAQLRYAGCMDAMIASGIAFDEEADYEGVRFSFADGYRAAKALLARGREFTALFAIADVMAIGAIRALQDAGLRVPEDVSVVGFDGLDVGEYTVPRLATISQDVERLADRSVALLLQQIESPAKPVYEILPVSLAWKESTRQIG